MGGVGWCWALVCEAALRAECCWARCGRASCRAAAGSSVGAADGAAGVCAGDGWLDMFVANLGAANALYRNNRGGVFPTVPDAGDSVTDSAGSRSAAWGDYDGAPGRRLRRQRAGGGWPVGALAGRDREVRAESWTENLDLDQGD